MKVFFQAALLCSLCCFSTGLLAQPTANFTATPLSGCAPLLVSFTNTSSGSPTSYFWNLGNGVTSVVQHPSTTYTLPGTYTVTLTATNAAGSDTKVMTNYVTVSGGPVVDFTVNDTAACPPMAVSFTNTTNPIVPGPATYQWSFGDGSPLSGVQHPGHIYTAPGYYNVLLTATNAAGCSGSLSKAGFIHVYTPPSPGFTATPTSYCDAPATVSFNAPASGNGPYVYQWDFGDGGTGATAAPVHTYSNSGSYTVSLIITDANGCKDTLVKTNYINLGATTPSFTPTSGCIFAPVSFTNTSTATDSVKWDFGDGATTNAYSPTHTYNTAGVFNVKLVIYYGLCKDSVIVPFTVHPQPVATINYSPAQPCPPPSLVQFTGAGAASYTWSFGDGATGSGSNTPHTYVLDSIFSVRAIAISTHGCKDTLYDTVAVYDLYFNINPFDTGGCAPLTVPFRASLASRDPITRYNAPYPYPVSSYAWDLGNGVLSAASNIATTYTIPGMYTVTLAITTSNGCIRHDTTTASAGNMPVASFTISDDTICVNAQEIFTSTSTGPSPLQLGWAFGGITTPAPGPVANPVIHHYGTSGVYNVVHSATHFGCQDTAMRTVVVLPPTSVYTIDRTCDSILTVKLKNTGTAGATSWIWHFGDGATDTAANPVHTYPALGTYNIILYSYNNINGCSDSTVTTLAITDPVLNFTVSDTAICRGDSVTFTATYAGYTLPYSPSIIWWIDSNWPALEGDTTSYVWGHRFEQTGHYTINALTGYPIDNSPLTMCWDTLTRTDYITVAKPTAGFLPPKTLGCAPLTVTFTDTSTNTPGVFQVTRNWDFGNGLATVTTPSTTNTYFSAGAYVVQLITTDNVGCSDTISRSLIVVYDPVATFTVNDSNACIGELIQFSNTTAGGGVTCLWDFGDGSTDTAQNPAHAYAGTGSYTVTLMITDATGCKDTLTKQNHILIAKPVASFSMSDTQAVCPPLNVLITNTSTGAASYVWAFGNGTGSTLMNPIGSYTVPGIYTLQLIAVNAEGCGDTTYGQVKVLGYGGALTYTPLKGCGPLEVDFKSTVYNIPSVLWDFADGVTALANGVDTISHIYQTPGLYVPRLILSDNAGCQSSSPGLDTIVVDGVLAGFVTSPLCVNTNILFTDTSFSFFSPVTQWSWTFSNGTSSINAPSRYYTVAGTYPVSLIATNGNGCSDTVTTNITILELPAITASADTSICLGDQALLAVTGGISYSWTPAASLSCYNCPDPTATPSASTSYIVTGTDQSGCINRDTVRVALQLVTTSEAGKGGPICADSSFQLTASGADHYEWTPAATLNFHDIADPLASPAQTTTYVVTAWEGSCPPDTHSVQVIVFPKPVVDAGTDVTIVAGTATMLSATGTNLQAFLWYPAVTLSCDTCSNPMASPTVTTLYKVVGISGQGCKAYDSVTVHLLCDNSQLFIPNSFTPNSDGENDIFYVRGGGLLQIRSFRVYNRWGEVLFEKTNVQPNDPSGGWDGSYKGSMPNPDTYVYVVDGICQNGEPISWKGDITLLR